MLTTLLLSFGLVADIKLTDLECAIWQVESGKKLTGDKPILGDWCPRRKRFMSRGPLQISEAYHKDSGVKFPYHMVDDMEHAVLTMRGFMKRYAREDRKPAGMSWNEMKARMHNGGPRGHWRIEATQKYWEKTQVALADCG